MVSGTCSCWSLLCFVWLSGFHLGTKQKGQSRPTGRLKGNGPKGPELRLQILCKFHKCLIIVHGCLLAFIHVCGPVSTQWCHSLSIIDSCWFIFSALPVRLSGWLLQSPAFTQGHSIGRYNRSQTWGQEKSEFLIYRQHKHICSIPSFNLQFLHSDVKWSLK